MTKKNKILILFVIFFTAILIIYFYILKNYTSHSNIPTLKPDLTPYKVKPEQRGGIIIPHSDSLVYDKLNQGKGIDYKITLAPKPEQPIFIDFSSNQGRKVETHSIEDILNNLELYEEQIIAEHIMEEDDSIIMPSTIKKETKDKEEDPNEKAVELNFNTDLQVKKLNDDRYDFDDITEDNFDVESGYKVQLAAAYSMSDASRKWRLLHARYNKILNNSKLITKKVESQDEKFFYIIMAGNYKNISDAKMICRKLIYKKQHCIVVKP